MPAPPTPPATNWVAAPIDPASAPASLPAGPPSPTAQTPAVVRPKLPPADTVRDLGTLTVLIWALAVPWNGQHKGAEIVYVLLTALCAMASVVMPYLQRASVSNGGRPPSSVGTLRILLVAPLFVVMAITLVRSGVSQGSVYGYGVDVAQQGVFLAGFGAALAIVPRSADLVSRPDGALIARRWRLVAGWLAGLGFAAWLIVVLVGFAQTSTAGGGGLLALVWVLFGGITLVVAFCAIPVLRVGADHPAWQPPALWFGFGMAFVIAVSSGGSPMAGGGSWIMLVFWAVVVGGGLCAMPFVGGRDGSPETVEFWALVVINALKVILWVSIVLAATVIATLVTLGGGAVSGSFVWTLVEIVITGIAAGVGMFHLRADAIRGRSVALTCVAIMIAVALISVIVAAAGPGGVSAIVTGVPVLAGTYGVVLVGLLAPKAVRDAHGARMAGAAGVPTYGYLHATTVEPAIAATPPAAEPVTGNVVSPTSTYTGPTPGAAVGATTGSVVGASVSAPAPPAPSETLDTHDVPVGSGELAEDLDSTVLRPRRSADKPAAVDDPQRVAARDPRTPLGELMTIAHTRADLRAAVAENPSTYPDLLTWLGQLGDPAVDAALAGRSMTTP